MLGLSYQLWKFNDDGKLINKAVGSAWKNGDKKFMRENHYITEEASWKVLDIKGGSNASGTAVILYTNYGTANQKWYFKPESKFFFIASQAHKGMVLDITAGKKGGELLAYTGR